MSAVRGATSIPIRCTHCGGTVILEVEDWPAALIPEALEPREVPAPLRRRWECPYCRVENETGLPGRISRARKAGEVDG